MPNLHLPKSQQGVTLIIAMVILIGVTVVSMSSLTVSLLEVRMAENEEARMTAFQKAQAGVEAITSTIAGWAVTGSVGTANCTTDPPSTSSAPNPAPPLGCTAPDITLPAGFDGRSSAYVERLSPRIQCPLAAMKSSCDKFSVATYGIVSRFDDTQARRGRSMVTQGFGVLIPNPKP